ncbi:hypothetical protein [Phormidium nigroviride]
MPEIFDTLRSEDSGILKGKLLRVAQQFQGLAIASRSCRSHQFRSSGLTRSLFRFSGSSHYYRSRQGDTRYD